MSEISGKEVETVVESSGVREVKDSKDEEKVEAVQLILNSSLYVRASELLARTVLAAKDGDGKIFWLELEKDFHSTLVKTAHAILKKSGMVVVMGTVKKALFKFLLEVANGYPQQDFFNRKEVEAKSNRVNRERKRLARKRSRAAKREREREEKKIETIVKKTGQSRTCDMCGKKFNSRKRLSKHACKPKPEEVQETVSKVSEAKRARRAKARQARKLKKREEQPNAQVTDVDTSVSTDEDVRSETSDSTVIANIHTVNTAVTEVLRVKTDILCEVCEKPAVGLRRGVYPKCFAHRADPYQFEFFT